MREVCSDELGLLYLCITLLSSVSLMYSPSCMCLWYQDQTASKDPSLFLYPIVIPTPSLENSERGGVSLLPWTLFRSITSVPSFHCRPLLDILLHVFSYAAELFGTIFDFSFSLFMDNWIFLSVGQPTPTSEHAFTLSLPNKLCSYLHMILVFASHFYFFRRKESGLKIGVFHCPHYFQSITIIKNDSQALK